MEQQHGDGGEAGEEPERLVQRLAKAKAHALLERGRLDRLTVIDRRRSGLDPFVKYLFRSPDGALHEVMMETDPLRGEFWQAFDRLAAYDRRFFPEARDSFLAAWITLLLPALSWRSSTFCVMMVTAKSTAQTLTAAQAKYAPAHQARQKLAEKT